jgi:hypothetical protein
METIYFSIHVTSYNCTCHHYPPELVDRLVSVKHDIWPTRRRRRVLRRSKKVIKTWVNANNNERLYFVNIFLYKFFSIRFYPMYIGCERQQIIPALTFKPKVIAHSPSSQLSLSSLLTSPLSFPPITSLSTFNSSLPSSPSIK